jgi:parvulin-like peptidyl-prolyl isomerase
VKNTLHRRRAVGPSLLAIALAVAGCKVDGSHAGPASRSAVVSPTTAPQPTIVYRDKIVYVDRPVPTPGPTTSPVLATVGREGHRIEVRLSDVTPYLLSTSGLDVTFFYIRLKLAEAALAERGGTAPITDADVDAEIKLQIAKIAPDASPRDYPQLIAQLLKTQQISRAEFDLAMRTNACLRRLADAQILPVTDDKAREYFNALYGERAVCRHIACANLQEIQEAQRRLAAGEKFEDVARSMSRNRITAPLGGELPPFTRASYTLSNLPKVFSDTAFSLKPGEVSEAVQAGDEYHLIKLEKLIPPKAFKFEDMKESVVREMRERAIEAGMAQYIKALGEQAKITLKISDPILEAQYKERVQTIEDADKPTTRRLGQEAAPAPTAGPSDDRAAETLRRLRAMKEEQRAATQPAAKP